MRLWHLILNISAISIYASMLVKAWLFNTWENDVVELLAGFAGTVISLFPYEASLFQGYWGWSHAQWRIQPEGWIKFAGMVFLVLAAYSMFTGSEFLDDLFRR